ncbi:MAG: glucosidase [Bacteroidetes bacterium OLB12]|nr:MAG: glucosidase [Bacteroidetes bacterium OLB12]
MTAEKQRLIEDRDKVKNWRQWGPYLAERQWGTVREDYSANGDAWNYISHDMARSKAYRWGEEGIAGISDENQLLCLALSLWNKKDPILKERFFGLTNPEGNHGEDVKEIYYYLDSTPTHSYMRMLYKYPQSEYPYAHLVEESKRRGKHDREFELTDTNIFANNRYFDVAIEYAKADVSDMLMRITVTNRGPEAAAIELLPTLWFRNTWAWGYDATRPEIYLDDKGIMKASHKQLGSYYFYCEGKHEALFCENDTNTWRLHQHFQPGTFKDGINDYIIFNYPAAINKVNKGTKAAYRIDLNLKAGESKSIRLRLVSRFHQKPFQQFDQIFKTAKSEADIYYADLQKDISSEEEKMIQRQALAGMLWSKQFYYYDLDVWLRGDPHQPHPPAERRRGRNSEWDHLHNADIISMPDKWEYPWYAAWDLAFHAIPLAMIDPEFAKKQLLLLTKEWYMHPNGQLPAYEWAFGDVNPPVHAWAAWRVFKIDSKLQDGKHDRKFLEEIFHKLLLNFTWWVNKKDESGNNIFQGGFLGMDNIGVFDRSSTHLPTGGYIEQSDGTSWMAMYTLNLLRMALELAKENPTYQSMATKFFEHFLYIAGAMANVNNEGINLWDEEDEFFYDVLHLPNNERLKLKVRSMVGLIPLFAVEVLDEEIFQKMPEFTERLDWFLQNRPDLANLISRWGDRGKNQRHLLSLLRGHRMKRLLKRMLDEKEFLSPYGVRALSRHHLDNPYVLHANGSQFSVCYQPGESDSYLFGGNSNWRGPVWFPVNYLIIESLQRFHHYYGDDFKVEHPTGSGNMLTLREIASELSQRLIGMFKTNAEGKRPIYGDTDLFQSDPEFKNHLLFYEYFDGDTGRGLGASHQTGWTGLVAKLIQPILTRKK